MDATGEIRLLLAQARSRDRVAMERLLSVLYRELHLMAHRQLRRHRPSQTLNTTALVHEAYLKLAGGAERGWNDRKHFLAVVATAMRQIIVDTARQKGATKRGGDLRRVPLDDAVASLEGSAADLLALDEALERLAELDERLPRIVEMRYFAGLTCAETAEALGVSEVTVGREWRKARAMLRLILSDDPVPLPGGHPPEVE